MQICICIWMSKCTDSMHQTWHNLVSHSLFLWKASLPQMRQLLSKWMTILKLIYKLLDRDPGGWLKLTLYQTTGQADDYVSLSPSLHVTQNDIFESTSSTEASAVVLPWVTLQIPTLKLIHLWSSADTFAIPEHNKIGCQAKLKALKRELQACIEKGRNKPICAWRSSLERSSTKLDC